MFAPNVTTQNGAAITTLDVRQHVPVASTSTAMLVLPEGEHYLRLKVTNSAGNSDTDGARIQIRPPVPHGDNALRNPGFEDGQRDWAIARAAIVTVHSGGRALRIDPEQSPSVRQRIPVSPNARYRITAWVRRSAASAPPVTVGTGLLQRARQTAADDRAGI